MPRAEAAQTASKKKSLHDSQRDTPRVKRLRREFDAGVRTLAGELLGHLKFIDEFGVHLGLTRLFGRAAPGERVTEGTPGYSGAHYTVVAALGLQGIGAPWVFEGATNGVAFETYVDQVLSPTLHAGDLVLIDNLSAHKREPIRERIESRGARLHFLPPYSADWNPIELCWAKVKAALRAVDRSDVLAWFAHCGYTV